MFTQYLCKKNLILKDLSGLRAASVAHWSDLSWWCVVCGALLHSFRHSHMLCLISSLFIIDVCCCARCMRQNPGQLSWGPDWWWNNNSWLYWMFLARKSSTVPLCLLSSLLFPFHHLSFSIPPLSSPPLCFLSSPFPPFAPSLPPLVLSPPLQIYMQSSHCSSLI